MPSTNQGSHNLATKFDTTSHLHQKHPIGILGRHIYLYITFSTVHPAYSLCA